MEYSVEKLQELRSRLTQITKDVETGILPPSEAAERITQVREEMEKIIKRLKEASGKA